jgi:cytochrome c biogenesis protein CcdA
VTPAAALLYLAGALLSGLFCARAMRWDSPPERALLSVLFAYAWPFALPVYLVGLLVGWTLRRGRAAACRRRARARLRKLSARRAWASPEGAR